MNRASLPGDRRHVILLVPQQAGPAALTRQLTRVARALGASVTVIHDHDSRGTTCRLEGAWDNARAAHATLIHACLDAREDT